MHAEKSSQAQYKCARQNVKDEEVATFDRFSERCLQDCNCHDRENYNVAQHRIEKEHDEVLVVVHADAVAHPGTVMVHSQHTFAADGAVM